MGQTLRNSALGFLVGSLVGAATVDLLRGTTWIALRNWFVIFTGVTLVVGFILAVCAIVYWAVCYD